MGYTTKFQGSLQLSPALTADQTNYINLLSKTRRMKRDVETLQSLYNGEHGLNGSYGIDGEYFAKDDGNYGQSSDSSIIEYNCPPATQPGLWCQWVITEDGYQLVWDGGEKFYSYTEWLQYYIDNFFNKWGIKLNGSFKYQGEEMDDQGLITVIDNLIIVTELN